MYSITFVEANDCIVWTNDCIVGANDCIVGAKQCEPEGKFMSNESKQRLTSTKKLVLLVTIVKKNKVDYYLDLIEEHGVNMQINFVGNGTTKSAIFTDEIGTKGIILSIVTEDKINAIMNNLKIKFAELKDGKGVAWTVPLSSVMGVTFFNFLSNNVGSII